MKAKKIIFILLLLIVAVSAVAVIATFSHSRTEPAEKEPVLIKERAVLKIEDAIAKDIEKEVVCDVILSSLGDDIYPGASFVIDFDKTKLEFLSVSEGNILIPSDNGEELPKWSYNAEKANDEGQIKIMYLDLTGGMKAFSDAYVQKDNPVLLRLRFRVRGAANVGEKISLSFSDAIFAANDETKSLSMQNGTLKVSDGYVKIGG